MTSDSHHQREQGLQRWAHRKVHGLAGGINFGKNYPDKSQIRPYLIMASEPKHFDHK
jgi:hypothetical protein